MEGQPENEDKSATPSQIFDDWLIGKRPSLPLARDWLWQSLTPELFPLHLTWVFTFVLAVFALFAWNDSKDASRRTEEQLRLLQEQQRPWVYFDEVVISQWAKVPDDEDALQVVVGLTLKNSGKTPGEFAFVNVALWDPTSQGWDQTNEDFMKHCKFSEAHPMQQYGGLTVFPNASQTANIIAFNDSKKNVDKILREDKLFRPAILACVHYVSPVDQSPHFTRIGFILKLKADAHVEDREIQASDIDLKSTNHLGSRAD